MAVSFTLIVFFIMHIASIAFSMTMEEAVKSALILNPDLKVLRLEEEVGKGQLEKARLPLITNPTVEASLVKKGQPPEEGGRRSTDHGISLSQEFEVAGQRNLRIDVAEKDLSRIGFEIKNRERSLVYEVKDTFVKTLALKRKVELMKETLKLKGELLSFTKIKFEAGDVSGLEVNIAEVETGKSKTELLAAEREYRESLLAIQGVIGLTPTLVFTVEGEIRPEILSIPDTEILKKSAMRQRPDLKAAAFEIEKNRSEYDLNIKKTVPNITVSAFYNRDEERDVVGLAFSIPIPLFDRKQAERREALVRLEQARIKYPNVERTIGKEIEEAHANLISSAEELKIFRKEMLNKAMENLDLLNLAFKEGKIGFFDVRLAQKDNIDIQFAYIDATLRAQLSINALERIVGGELK